MNPLLEIHKAGQSIWLDFITRKFMTDGKLAKLITEDGLSGVTSNPTIFQKAIMGGQEYDTTISGLIKQGKSSAQIFDALAIEDIQRACDLFRSVYDKTQGADGFVSLEVNPQLARDTKSTLEEARRLFKAVARPNVMIKIPGTQEGLPSIEQAIGEGININITLIFALERYQEVIDAWLGGLERLDKTGKALASIGSVASFFVSRVDTLVDGVLEKEKPSGYEALRGKAAIANARLAYAMFLKMKNGPRFKALAAKGARVQRPLWASTSTKNPKYRDVLYVEELIGSETVNTVPLATVDAARDHAQVKTTLPGDTGAAQKAIQDLEKVGISMKQVTQQLEEDGVKLFSDSYDELLKNIEQKRDALKSGVR
jgi:transaldolase